MLRSVRGNGGETLSKYVTRDITKNIRKEIIVKTILTMKLIKQFLYFRTEQFRHSLRLWRRN
jgi:hypothetical protein